MSERPGPSPYDCGSAGIGAQTIAEEKQARAEKAAANQVKLDQFVEAVQEGRMSPFDSRITEVLNSF